MIVTEEGEAKEAADELQCVAHWAVFCFSVHRTEVNVREDHILQLFHDDFGVRLS